MPEILSPIQRRLEAVQDVIYFGSEVGPVSIKQAVGLTQGQATSGQLYSLGIHPLNEELSALAHQHESGILSAYIDDVKAHSDAELIAGIIAVQQSKGPDFGAKLNMNNTSIGFSCNRVRMTIAQCGYRATSMTHSRSRATEFTFTRTTSQILWTRPTQNCTMGTSSSGFQHHLLRSSLTPLSRVKWRRSPPNGAWLRFASRTNHITCGTS